MPAVARIGDSHSCGGTIIEGSPNVFAESIEVARLHDDIICPNGTGQIDSGSPNVFVNGKAVARIGDSVHCPDCNGSITTGASTVFAN